MHQLKVLTEDNKYETVLISKSFTEINKQADTFTKLGFHTIIEVDLVYELEEDTPPRRWLELLALFVIAGSVVLVL